MTDRFLREVERMHKLRRDINEMTAEEADELIRGLGDDAAEDWIFAARDAQLPPPDLSWLANRTRCRGRCILRCAGCFSGKSGIFATCGRDPRPRWLASRRLEWPNGAMCVFFSGEEPESLRGPQAEMVIVDEIARMRYQQSVFDTMMLGLRLGDRPRVLIATTPRTTRFTSVGGLSEKGARALRRHEARPSGSCKAR